MTSLTNNKLALTHVRICGCEQSFDIGSDSLTGVNDEIVSTALEREIDAES